MSLEKIIDQINSDTKKEVDSIIREANKQADRIIKESMLKTQNQINELLLNGEKKSYSLKQIIISKENQNAKKLITKNKEEIIEYCFDKAFLELTNLNKKDYERLINRFIKEGIKKIGYDCTIKISKDVDKLIAKKHKIKVIGKINSIGGIIIISSDGKITLDYTFEGIIKRKKDMIRIKVGKILFS